MHVEELGASLLFLPYSYTTFSVNYVSDLSCDFTGLAVILFFMLPLSGWMAFIVPQRRGD